MSELSLTTTKSPLSFPKTFNQGKAGMINKEAILKCIEYTMDQYQQKMTKSLGDWEPLVDASEKLLAGKVVKDNELPPPIRPLVKMMKLIMEVTKESEWDWSNPAIQEIFKDKAESQIYKIFTESIVGIVFSIMRTVEIGTLVEVGTGPGQVTSGLCKQMIESEINTPIVISDRAPSISQTGKNLRKSFPSLTINDFIWDIGENPPKGLTNALTKPVLLFERFCLPYAGYSAIDKIGPIADILVLEDDLNLTGKKEAPDLLYEKIGAKFLTFKEAKKYLGKHFSLIHTCDKKTIESINAFVTTFTLAVK